MIKRVSVRELLRDFGKYSRELPIIVTRWNKPLFVLTTLEDYEDLLNGQDRQD